MAIKDYSEAYLESHPLPSYECEELREKLDWCHTGGTLKDGDHYVQLNATLGGEEEFYEVFGVGVNPATGEPYMSGSRIEFNDVDGKFHVSELQNGRWISYDDASNVLRVASMWETMADDTLDEVVEAASKLSVRCKDTGELSVGVDGSDVRWTSNVEWTKLRRANGLHEFGAVWCVDDYYRDMGSTDDVSLAVMDTVTMDHGLQVRLGNMLANGGDYCVDYLAEASMSLRSERAAAKSAQRADIDVSHIKGNDGIDFGLGE